MTASVFRADLLASRVAFITGGSSGINKGIARRFLEHGARVVIVARDPAREHPEIGVHVLRPVHRSPSDDEVAVADVQSPGASARRLCDRENGCASRDDRLTNEVTLHVHAPEIL